MHNKTKKPAETMKKLSLLMVTLMLAGLWSCGNSENDSEATDSIVNDTISATGIVIDGAMNSVIIVPDSGDTLYFSYPELDPESRYGWSIGDTITVNYVDLDGEMVVTSLTDANAQ